MNFEKSQKIKLLESAFGSGFLEPGEENLHLSCPVCNDIRESKKKLYICLDTGWYNCWVCNTSGKNINFLFRKHAASLLSRCIELFPDDRINTETIKEDIKPVELPDDSILVADGIRDPDVRDVVRYLQSRGMTRLDMLRWRVCASQRFDLRRKAIFPSFDETGKLNYYVARAIDETKFKYNNAKVPKRNIVFNEIDIDWKEPVILVEGIFDAVKCPDNTVVALGSTLSKKSKLYNCLAKNECTIIVAFDEDAEEKTHQVCKKLYESGCKVFKVTVTENDLGSRTKEEVKKILSLATPWTQISMLSDKISRIKSGSIL